MRVLAVHNRYLHRGGEDVVFDTETRLLEQRGHDVTRFIVDNADVDGQHRVALAMRTVWNPLTFSRVRAIIRDNRPDVMHVHNILPLISPSVYAAAHQAGVPVVQTLHNFRLICPGALLLRDGKPCEECIRTLTPWPGVVHGCYRDDRAATAVVSLMLTTHSLVGTWRRFITRYIALSEFAVRKFVEAGWPAEQFDVHPNFLDADPGMRPPQSDQGYVLFVGRLSKEKGIGTLLEAWSRKHSTATLKIVGSGPLMPADLHERADIEWLGHQPREQVLSLMRGAAFVVVPSECYETSPLAIVEAFASGTPVIASQLGAMAEMVQHGRTGWLFTSRNPTDLARILDVALRSPGKMAQMAAQARLEFERRYTADIHYQGIIRTYEEAIHGVSVHSQTVRIGTGAGPGSFRADAAASAGTGPGHGTN